MNSNFKTTNLLNRELIKNNLTKDAAWHESHGADCDYLGFGLIYYSLAYLMKAKVCVCLGSGGGFVPRMMRQAQRDINIESKTFLVDGDYPEAGWDRPRWLDKNSFFKQNYPDIEILIMKTKEAADIFKNIKIDYLHIDADHSYNGCYEDFQTYKDFMSANSVITLHDTGYPLGTTFSNYQDQSVEVGVPNLVEYIKTLKDFEIINFPEIAAGVAIVRKKVTPPQDYFTVDKIASLKTG